MDRRHFIQSLGAVASIIPLFGMQLRDLEQLARQFTPSEKMPVMFVGHGSPMNAIEDNKFSRGWRDASKNLQPQVILCISAHWESRGTFLTFNEKPRTIHDFGGFPQALFDVQYPAPGSRSTAELIQDQVSEPKIHFTEEWGLDHGTWSVLRQMFPNADIPVIQMSLDRGLSPQKMYDLGKRLSFLRERGVLILGSGNIVHNLGMIRWGENPEPYDWALSFDEKVKSLIDRREHASLIDFSSLGTDAKLSIPTPEHYLPMLYILGLQEKQEEVYYFNEWMAFGSGSMRSFLIT